MTEAIIILMNMRGGCATVGDKVHTLFRVSNRRPFSKDVKNDAMTETERTAGASSPASA